MQTMITHYIIKKNTYFKPKHRYIEAENAVLLPVKYTIDDNRMVSIVTAFTTACICKPYVKRMMTDY